MLQQSDVKRKRANIKVTDEDKRRRTIEGSERAEKHGHDKAAAAGKTKQDRQCTYNVI